MEYWLIVEGVLQAIRFAGSALTSEQQDKITARYIGADDEGVGSRILTITGDTALIEVKGVLTHSFDFYALLFGGGNTLYTEIVSALNEAEGNADVKKIDMHIGSPGGTIAGLFETLSVLKGLTKPTRAIVATQACSAAYALAAQCDNIVATNVGALFGCIGVVKEYYVSENEVSVASTKAPKKRPDVTTEAGKAIVREELDAMHELFVAAIAEGRNTTTDIVNSDYGQGATLLANQALKNGLIDVIEDEAVRPEPIEPNTTNALDTEQKLEAKMDPQKLKVEHPETYAAVFELGVAQERDRVSAHLTMGGASGDMKTAIAAAKDGTGMTATMQANYMAASMNRKDLENHTDDDAGSNAANNAAGGGDALDDESKVASMVEELMGVETEAANG